MKIPFAVIDFDKAIRETMEASLINLLQSKHLYQNVRLDTHALAECFKKRDAIAIEQHLEAKPFFLKPVQ